MSLSSKRPSFRSLVLPLTAALALAVAVMLATSLSGCGEENPAKPSSNPAAPAAPEQVTSYTSRHPDISPDGTKLAMTLDNGGVAVASIDGSQLDTLAIIYAFDDPDWYPPDGSMIVVYGGGWLWRIDVDTKEVSALGSGDVDGDPEWSADGSKIAAHTTMAGDGIGITTYPGGTWSILPCAKQDGSNCAGRGPTWAPDGSAIAFDDGYEILRVPSSGGTATVVVEGVGDLTRPSWSPDGNWIAFAVDSTNVGHGPWLAHIWVVDQRGMQYGLRQITFGPSYDSDPSWSPDSRTIYFSSGRGGFSAIWKVAVQP